MALIAPSGTIHRSALDSTLTAWAEGAFHRRARWWAGEMRVASGPTNQWAEAAAQVARGSPCPCDQNPGSFKLFTPLTSCVCDEGVLAAPGAHTMWRRLWALWVIEDAIAELVHRSSELATPEAVDEFIRPFMSTLQPRLAPSRWRAAWEWALPSNDAADDGLTNVLTRAQEGGWSRRTTPCPRPLRQRPLCGTGWLLAVECTRLGVNFDDASPDVEALPAD